MDPLSSAHLGAVAATAALCATAVRLPRARPGGWVVVASRALAIAIVAAFAVDQLTAAQRELWTVRTYLPLHLSDVATITAALALWTARPALVELTYFWGLTASLQATLTPDLGPTYPDVLFWTFFVTHAGVVAAALLLVAGRRIIPAPGAVRRAFAATLLVASGAAAGCLLTGGNYMFLRRKPDGSLLDLLGPWPWYVGGAALLALALFAALDAPLRRARRRAHRGAGAISR